MKKGSEHMMFAHSPDGVPLSVVYDDLLYYYVTNLQGDVVAILDATGAEVVTYTYDAWGNILSIGGEDANTLGRTNPLRYRGYVYDQETGLYYLQSRYYDPEVGRWINADGELSEIGGDLRGYNLFAYCFNNPANMDDPTGDWPKWLSGAINIACGVAQAAVGAALGATVGWTGVGAVVAATLVLNGAATATQGVGQIVNDITNSYTMREDNIIRTGFSAVGGAIGGNTGATIGGMVYDIGTMALTAYGMNALSSPVPTSGYPPQPLHTTGTCSPKKVSNPGGSYTQLDGKGNIYSYAQYDYRGNQTLRIDFQGKAHAGYLPHIHIFEYPELGGKVERIYDLFWNRIG